LPYGAALATALEIGRFLDPIATSCCIGDAVHADNSAPFGACVLPALVILCREILSPDCRVLAGLRVGMPVSRLAKWKTVIQMVAIGVLIVAMRTWISAGRGDRETLCGSLHC